MSPALMRLLGGARVELGKPALRVISSREAAEAQAEALRLGIPTEVCVLARAIVRRRRLRSGLEVLRRYSDEEIRRMTERLRRLEQAENPGCGQPLAQTEAMMDELAHLPEERIRWKVLRAFGVLPGEARAREMTDADYLYCVMQLLLDERERLDALCPSCRAAAEETRCTACGAPIHTECSGSFDPARFEELSRR